VHHPAPTARYHAWQFQPLWRVTLYPATEEDEVTLTQVCNTNSTTTPISNYYPSRSNYRHRMKRRRIATGQTCTTRDKSTTAKGRIELLRSVCNGISNIGVNILHDCVISLEVQLVLSVGLNFIPPPRISQI
jgi:hypothetical protein